MKSFYFVLTFFAFLCSIEEKLQSDPVFSSFFLLVLIAAVPLVILISNVFIAMSPALIYNGVDVYVNAVHWNYIPFPFFFLCFFVDYELTREANPTECVTDLD